jgi:DNA-binding GntR family transcriptional regulator
MSESFSSSAAARPVRHGGLVRHRVRDGVQQLILSGEYQPGQRLLQQELAARFQVAQGVVREALLELQFCGLVQAVDNLGMFVSGLGARVILDAYEIREVLDGLAARRCCENASRADLRELNQLAQEVQHLGDEGKVDAMGKADHQFHYRMIVASQNQVLAKLTDGYRVLGMFVRANRHRQEVYEEHLQILRAIESNQPEQAEALARHHVVAAREEIARQVAEGTFVPYCVSEAEELPKNNRPRAEQPSTASGRKKKPAGAKRRNGASRRAPG